MKKLCIDARMIQHSGIGTYLQNILPLIKDFFKITLLGDRHLLEPILNDLSFAIIDFTAPIYSLSEQFLLPLKIPACDIFWSPHYNVPYFPIRAKKRVVTIHDVFHLAFSEGLSVLKKAYAKIIMDAAVNKSSCIITVSDFSRTEILKYSKAKAEKISVIHNGVNSHYFKPETDKIKLDRVRTKYHIHNPYILFVGNVKPHKNLKTLLIAFSMFKKTQATTLQIVIVGKKEGFITGDDQIGMLINSLQLEKEVVFLGKADSADLPAIYSTCSLFVFPSLYEGFGLPPLEAMACGIPVLLSDQACMPEIFGTGATYFHAGEPTHLNSVLLDFFSNEQFNKKKMVESGFNIVKKYNWEQAAKEHIRLLNQL